MAMILLGGSGGHMQELISPFLIPTFRHLCWATQYGLWYESNGRQGWRPPEDIARMQEVYEGALLFNPMCLRAGYVEAIRE